MVVRKVRCEVAGCPLAPAGFAVGQRVALDRLLHELLQLEPNAKLYSYLDNTYLVINRNYVALALAGLREALAPLGLEPNERRTLLWSPAGPQAVPGDMRRIYTATLPVLGTHLKSRGDVAEAPLRLGHEGSGLDEVTERLEKLWASLRNLQQAGRAGGRKPSSHLRRGCKPARSEVGARH